MRYLLFISVLMTGMYALITGPRQVEVAIAADLPIEEKIRRMDEINATYSYGSLRLPANQSGN
ncbi:MAG: hypothetical protein KF767_10280 [Bdellovibrionaceae bacterium]|nr:hypothetical protein [Pseudobdellovibrionaceae bacterium]